MASKNAHVGGVGEDFLGVLCHQAQITSNKVQFDDKGWDCFLQFPQEGAGCLVQVKTTQGSRRVSVARKAWRHLAAMPMPAFFFVVILDKHMQPQRGYLVHVDEPMMTDVLSRDERGSKALIWRERHGLPSLSGQELKAAILRHVGEDFAKYTARKLAHLRQQESHEMKVTMPEAKREETYELMSNFAIGVGGPLRVKHLDHVPIKFGRRGETERHDGATIECTPPSICDATVTVKNIVTGEQASFKAKTYSAANMFPWLPREFKKLRFVTEFLSITLTPDKEPKTLHASWHFKIDPAPLRLGDAVEIARAIKLLAGGSENELRTSFELEREHAPISTGEMPALGMSVEQRESTLRFTEALVRAWAVATAFALPPDTKVTAPGIEREADRLVYMNLPLMGHSDLRVRVPIKWDSGEKRPTTVALLMARTTKIGKHVLAAILAFRGTPTHMESDGEEWIEVADPAPHFMKRKTLSFAEYTKFDFKPLLLESKAILEKEGIDLVLLPREDEIPRGAAKQKRLSRQPASSSSRPRPSSSRKAPARPRRRPQPKRRAPRRET